MKTTKLDNLLQYISSHPGCTAKEVREALGSTEHQYLDGYYGYVVGNGRCSYHHIRTEAERLEPTSNKYAPRPEYIRRRKEKVGNSTRLVYKHTLTVLGQLRVAAHSDFEMNEPSK